MAQIQLTVNQTLVREAITARIQNHAQAVVKADREGNQEPLKVDSLGLFTALVAMASDKCADEAFIANAVVAGGTFLAREQKSQYQLSKAQELLQKPQQPGEGRPNVEIIDPQLIDMTNGDAHSAEQLQEMINEAE